MAKHPDNPRQDLDETLRGTAGFGSTGGHDLLSAPAAAQ